MAMITPALLTALRTAFRSEFQTALTETPSDYDKIATVVPSTSASNTYGWLGQFPSLREWIGDRVVKDMKAHGYAVTNKLWESTVGVQRTDIEDDNVGVYKPLMAEMGRAAKVQPDELAFALLKAGGATTCYDGQFFFDTDHPVYANVDGTGAVTTVANIQPGAGAGPAWYLLDCSRAVKPIIFQKRLEPEFTEMTDGKDESVFMKDLYRYGVRARNNVGFGFWQMAYKSTQDLTADNFNAAYAAMTSQKADGGRPLGIRPTLLVVPPSLRQQALNITKAELIGNGVTNVNAGLVDTLVTPWVL